MTLPDLNTPVSDFELASPFLDLEFPEIELWKAALLGGVWLILWVCIGTGLIWTYAVWFPAQVGFQTALLVGIALIALGEA